jgi:hypothetical protein
MFHRRPIEWQKEFKMVVAFGLSVVIASFQIHLPVRLCVNTNKISEPGKSEKWRSLRIAPFCVFDIK